MKKAFQPIHLTYLFHCHRSIMRTILTFLDNEDITILCDTYETTPQADPQITAILSAYIYLRKHLLATDRSFYYNLYDDSHFLEFQNAQIACLLQHPNALANLRRQRMSVIVQLQAILKGTQSESVLPMIEQMADDPQIPMGKLLRQNIGAGCSSQFQYFLVGLGCQESEESVEPELLPLQQYFQNRMNNYIRQFMKIIKDSHADSQRSAIRRLRMASFQINHTNCSQFMLKGNQLQNMLVCFFLLAEQLTISAQILIGQIEEPSYRMLELMLRYSMYRNFIISVQEKFSFIFRQYSELYADTFRDAEKCPEFNFWRPALAKWFMRMNKFHRDSHQTFNVYLFSQQIQHCLDFISDQDKDTFPDCLILLNKLTIDTKGIADSQPGTNKELREIISEQIEVLIREYSDYMMDLSVDEITVNWCGHTAQRLNFPFQEFSKTFHEQSKKLFQYFLSLSPDPHLGKVLIERCLQFLHQNTYIKCKNLKEIKMLADSLVVERCEGSEGVNFNPQFMDEDLQFFNSKRKIPLELPNQKIRIFSQIVPTPEIQVEIKNQLSLDSTLCDSQMLNESESMLVYQSEQEEDQCFVEYSHSMPEIQGFIEESEMEDESERVCSNQQLIH